MEQNIEFFKNINEQKIMDRYYLLKTYEKGQANSYLEAVVNLITLEQQKDSLTNMINIEKKAIFKQNIILIYNKIMYYLKLNIKKFIKDDELEKAFELLKKTNEIEFKCLTLINDLIKKQTSEPYIELYTLLKIKDEILKYHNNRLTINDSLYKGINVSIEEDDIKTIENNLETIKTIIKKNK